MVLKQKESNPRKRLLYCHLSSCSYIPFLTFFASIYGDLYKIVHLNSWFPLALLGGELLKSHFLLRTLNRNTKISNKKEILFSLLLCASSVCIFDFLEVCAGAPFFDKQSQTASLAIMLTVLTVVPSCLTIGYEETVELLLNISTYSGDLLSNIVKNNICFTLLGAWLGAIVIPLDWDRPWQVWPVPCYFGGLLGNVVGNMANLAFTMQSSSKDKRSFTKP